MNYILTSVTRISTLAEGAFHVRSLPRTAWARGDYVVGIVRSVEGLNHVELAHGRHMEVAEGDRVIGAFGRRFATLEATGDWQGIGEDGQMEMLTGGGLLGKEQSRSTLIPPLLGLTYEGHVMVGEHKATMQAAVEVRPERAFAVPTVLIIGTSMSAGKTTAGRIVVRQLKEAGLRVLAVKITGAARYRDVLSMGDAGADAIFDFVDVGLPSTVVPEADYRAALRQLLTRMAGVEADVAVVEVGASPLEPYNGMAAVEALDPSVRVTILCASDPFAVVGVLMAYGRGVDLVTGIATNTEAGIQLTRRLTGLQALNIRDRQARPALRTLLFEHLGLDSTDQPV